MMLNLHYEHKNLLSKIKRSFIKVILSPKIIYSLSKNNNLIQKLHTIIMITKLIISLLCASALADGAWVLPFSDGLTVDFFAKLY